MPDSNWFRNKEWNEEIEAKFLARLGRARSSRDQYLAIQCSMLETRYPETALRLADYYFDTRTDNFNDNIVLQVKGHAYFEQGQVEKAIEAYSVALMREVEFSKSVTELSTKLPYLIARLSRKKNYELAKTALDFAEEIDLLLFPSERFRWHAAHAMIAFAEGRVDYTKQHAVAALEEIDAKTSGFQHHAEKGLVQDVECDVLDRLSEIARSSSD